MNGLQMYSYSKMHMYMYIHTYLHKPTTQAPVRNQTRGNCQTAATSALSHYFVRTSIPNESK